MNSELERIIIKFIQNHRSLFLPSQLYAVHHWNKFLTSCFTCSGLQSDSSPDLQGQRYWQCRTLSTPTKPKTQNCFAEITSRNDIYDKVDSILRKGLRLLGEGGGFGVFRVKCWVTDRESPESYRSYKRSRWFTVSNDLFVTVEFDKYPAKIYSHKSLSVH